MASDWDRERLKYEYEEGFGIRNKTLQEPTMDKNWLRLWTLLRAVRDKTSCRVQTSLSASKIALETKAQWSQAA